MSKKPMTLDELAAMIATGFAATATKEDLVAIRREMATKEDLATLRTELRGEIALVRTELGTNVHELRNEMRQSFLALSLAIGKLERERVAKLEKRVARLEERLRR